MAEKIKEKDMKAAVEEEKNMLDLVGVIKSEMDDARDFIHQVGADRAESTEYYLGTEPSSTSSVQSEFVSTDVRESVLFMLPSITCCAPAQEWCLRRPSCNIIQITSRAPLVPHSLVQVAETGTILAAIPNRMPARKSSRSRSVVQIFRPSCNGPGHDWRGLQILPVRLVKITWNKRKTAEFSEERTGPNHSSPCRFSRLR